MQYNTATKNACMTAVRDQIDGGTGVGTSGTAIILDNIGIDSGQNAANNASPTLTHTL